ncbi:hypothetical protein P9112_010005 [Eukaryota sp. TZLM1-RC]
MEYTHLLPSTSVIGTSFHAQEILTVVRISFDGKMEARQVIDGIQRLNLGFKDLTDQEKDLLGKCALYIILGQLCSKYPSYADHLASTRPISVEMLIPDHSLKIPSAADAVYLLNAVGNGPADFSGDKWTRRRNNIQERLRQEVEFFEYRSLLCTAAATFFDLHAPLMREIFSFVLFGIREDARELYHGSLYLRNMLQFARNTPFGYALKYLFIQILNKLTGTCTEQTKILEEIGRSSRFDRSVFSKILKSNETPLKRNPLN